MVAAGARSTGPLATISGVAPKAWLGSYKVFGTPGVNSGATDDAILKAIDDAVADGMDVISLSLGTDLPMRFGDDPEVEALENAASLGVIVVASAGNNGPDPATIGSPASGLSVIAVGASNNERIFAGSVLISGNDPLVALPGSGSNSSTPIVAPVADVSTRDDTGLACAALRSDSLSGSIALIARGTCTFETKLNNAAAAGAIGAIVFTTADQPDLITMSVGTATLPAEMVSYPGWHHAERQGSRRPHGNFAVLAIACLYRSEPAGELFGERAKRGSLHKARHCSRGSQYLHSGRSKRS
jgi:subtilisin family serine protease